MALIHEATISPRKDEISRPMAANSSLVGWRRRTRPGRRLPTRRPGRRRRHPMFPLRICRGIHALRARDLPRLSSACRPGSPHRHDAALGPRPALGLRRMRRPDAGLRQVVATICDGGNEAELTLRRGNGSLVRQTSTASVRGDGSIDLATPYPPGPVRAADESDRTTVHGHGFRLVVARRVGVVLPTGPALDRIVHRRRRPPARHRVVIA